jgi:hypothetical protein
LLLLAVAVGVLIVERLAAVLAVIVLLYQENLLGAVHLLNLQPHFCRERRTQ